MKRASSFACPKIYTKWDATGRKVGAFGNWVLKHCRVMFPECRNVRHLAGTLITRPHTVERRDVLAHRTMRTVYCVHLNTQSEKDSCRAAVRACPFGALELKRWRVCMLAAARSVAILAKVYTTTTVAQAECTCRRSWGSCGHRICTRGWLLWQGPEAILRVHYRAILSPEKAPTSRNSQLSDRKQKSADTKIHWPTDRRSLLDFNFNFWRDFGQGLMDEWTETGRTLERTIGGRFQKGED
jgi:hypothetical protein